MDEVEGSPVRLIECKDRFGFRCGHVVSVPVAYVERPCQRHVSAFVCDSSSPTPVRRYVCSVKRELDTFRAAAARVQADLQRTLDRKWSCTIDDTWVLTVGNNEQREVSALDDEVEDEEWYLGSDQTPVELAAALDAEAEEAVAIEAVEVLRVLGIEWPICGKHRRSMTNCEGSWVCNGPPTHDVALTGELGKHD